jgi:hypothetical protein
MPRGCGATGRADAAMRFERPPLPWIGERPDTGWNCAFIVAAIGSAVQP